MFKGHAKPIVRGEEISQMGSGNADGRLLLDTLGPGCEDSELAGRREVHRGWLFAQVWRNWRGAVVVAKLGKQGEVAECKRGSHTDSDEGSGGGMEDGGRRMSGWRQKKPQAPLGTVPVTHHHLDLATVRFWVGTRLLSAAR
jgi:hypothetical protein